MVLLLVLTLFLPLEVLTVHTNATASLLQPRNSNPIPHSIHHSSKQYFHFKHTRRTNHRTTTVVDAFGVDATTTAVGAEIYDDDVAFVIDVTGGDGDGDGAA